MQTAGSQVEQAVDQLRRQGVFVERPARAEYPGLERVLRLLFDASNYQRDLEAAVAAREAEAAEVAAFTARRRALAGKTVAEVDPGADEACVNQQPAQSPR